MKQQENTRPETFLRKTNRSTDQPEIFLRLPQIIGDSKKHIQPMLPVGRTTFLNKVKAGLWPSPVRITERTVAWRKSDIDRLLSDLSAS